MTTASRMDKQIRALLPLEVTRSPWVPTKRFGEHCLVAVAAPVSDVRDVAVVPAFWFAVSPDFSALLTFTRTRFRSPVRNFQSTSIEGEPTNLTPRDAHALLWRLSTSMWPEFFTGRPGVETDRADAIRAYATATPSRLQPWLSECCSDFFDWLRASN